MSSFIRLVASSEVSKHRLEWSILEAGCLLHKLQNRLILMERLAICQIDFPSARKPSCKFFAYVHFIVVTGEETGMKAFICPKSLGNNVVGIHLGQSMSCHS